MALRKKSIEGHYDPIENSFYKFKELVPQAFNDIEILKNSSDMVTYTPFDKGFQWLERIDGVLRNIYFFDKNLGKDFAKSVNYSSRKLPANPVFDKIYLKLPEDKHPKGSFMELFNVYSF